MRCEDCKIKDGHLSQGDMILCRDCNTKRFGSHLKTGGSQTIVKSGMDNNNGNSDVTVVVELREIKSSLSFISSMIEQIN